MLVLAAAAFCQTADPAKLKVRGVGLDSTYAQMVKALGKPVKDGKPVHEECIGGREKKVDYAGLQLYLMDGDSRDGKTFQVVTFWVTSPAWTVSGLRVGDAQAAVKAKLGSPTRVERRTDSGGLAWQYEFDSPGITTVIFKNGKVAEISSAFQMC